MKKFIKYIFFVLFLTLLINVEGQNRYKSHDELKEKAEELFKKREYTKALPLYSQLLSIYPKDVYYNYAFGVCVLFGDRRDIKKPIKYLLYASKKISDKPEATYYLAYAYHINYRFTEAIIYYENFKTLASNRLARQFEVDRKIQMCRNGMQLLTKVSDLYVIEKSSVKRKDFYRSYHLENFGGKLLSKPYKFKSGVDKRTDLESFIFFSDTNRVVYFSSYGGNKKTGKDIYFSKKQNDGIWSDPELFSPVINTPFDEDYPYMLPDGKTIYFSSKGHNSMGGYDIFKSTYDKVKKVWRKPVNLDFAINTPFDDILFVSDTAQKLAYFSSERSSVGDYVTVYMVRIDERPIVKEDFNLALASSKNIETAPPEYKAYIEYLSEKADLEVNATVDLYRPEVLENDLLADKNKKTVQETVYEQEVIPKEQLVEQLINKKREGENIADTAFALAKITESYAKELTDKMYVAYSIADKKKILSVKKQMEAESALTEADQEADLDRQGYLLNKAKTLLEEADQLIMEYQLSEKIGERLDDQIIIKDQEAQVILSYAGDIQKLAISGKIRKARNLLEDLFNIIRTADTLRDYKEEIVAAKEQKQEIFAKTVQQRVAIEDMAGKTKMQADRAMALAENKNYSSESLMKEAKQLIASINSTTPDDERQEVICKANELKEESVNLLREAVAAYIISTELNKKVKLEDEVANAARNKEEKIKNLLEDGQIIEAKHYQSQLNALLINRKSGLKISDKISGTYRQKVDSLNLLAAKEEQHAKELDKEATAFFQKAKSYRVKANNTKKESKINEFTSKAINAESEAQNREYESNVSFGKSEQLKEKATALLVQSDFVVNVYSKLISQPEEPGSGVHNNTIDVDKLESKIAQYKSSDVFSQKYSDKIILISEQVRKIEEVVAGNIGENQLDRTPDESKDVTEQNVRDRKEKEKPKEQVHIAEQIGNIKDQIERQTTVDPELKETSSLFINPGKEYAKAKYLKKYVVLINAEIDILKTKRKESEDREDKRALSARIENLKNRLGKTQARADEAESKAVDLLANFPETITSDLQSMDEKTLAKALLSEADGKFSEANRKRIEANSTFDPVEKQKMLSQAKSIENVARNLKKESYEVNSISNNNEYIKNSISIEEPLPKGLIYKIQIGAFKNDVTRDFYNGIKPISTERSQSGYIRYLAGIFSQYSAADIARINLRSIGYIDAFIVAYLNGRRINVGEARKVENRGGQESIATGVVANIDYGNKTPIKLSESTTPVYIGNINKIEDLFFTIQIGAYSRSRNSVHLKNISNLYFLHIQDGLWRYYSGIYKTAIDAEKAKKGVVAGVVHDAFIVAFYKGKRITIKRAGILLSGGAPQPDEQSITKATTQQMLIQDEFEDVKAEDIVFKVQIGAFLKEVPIEVVDLMLIHSDQKIAKYINNSNMTVYTAGEFTDYKSATAFKNRVVKSGVVDAFIVAFAGNKKIPVGRAIEIVNQ